MKKWSYISVCAILFLAGCRSDDFPIAVKELDIAGYCGRWYEIARLPNRFERGMTQVSAEYTLLPSGEVKIVNRGIKNDQKKSITGIARVPRKACGAELEVSFFKPFFSSYRIVKLGPDYRYSIVIGSNRKLLWVLARTPALSPHDRAEIKDFLLKHNFPPDQLIKSADL